MRKCRICECTDADGCALPDGCSWVADDLCSTCGDFLEMMAAYMMVAGPHDRHTIEHAQTAVLRCADELTAAGLTEPPPEPLIVLAKP